MVLSSSKTLHSVSCLSGQLASCESHRTPAWRSMLLPRSRPRTKYDLTLLSPSHSPFHLPFTSRRPRIKYKSPLVPLVPADPSLYLRLHALASPEHALDEHKDVDSVTTSAPNLYKTDDPLFSPTSTPTEGYTIIPIRSQLALCTSVTTILCS